VDPLNISVVVSTRNRGSLIIPTIESILASHYSTFSLCLIDQSENDLTEKAIKPYLRDQRIKYFRSKTRGVSTGRNIAIKGQGNNLVALTDDDCCVSKDWLEKMVEALSRERQIGVVFGSVLPGQNTDKAGIIASARIERTLTSRSLSGLFTVQGMAACMGLKREVWEKLAGFDEHLGIGARFPAAEEADFAFRALLSDFHVYMTPQLCIYHNGFKANQDIHPLIHQYWSGTGAMYAKNLRIYPATSFLLILLAWRWAFGKSLVVSSFNGPRFRFLRLTAFLKGFTRGFLHPLNRSIGHFQ